MVYTITYNKRWISIEITLLGGAAMSIEIKLQTGARVNLKEVESMELFHETYTVSHWVPMKEGSLVRELIFDRFPVSMVDRFTIINFEG